MRRKSVLSLVLVIAVCTILTSLVACVTVDYSDRNYWFSAYDRKFVKYDDNANDGKGNLDVAGTYWTMTLKRNANVSIKLRCDVEESLYAPYSTIELKINGKKVLRDEPDFFNVNYNNLTLKKGDKLEFHAYWINSLKTDDEGFTIDPFTLVVDDKSIVIKNIK